MMQRFNLYCCQDKKRYMRYLFSVIFLSVILISCKKDVDKRWDGIYQGIFQRQIGITGAVSNVSLTISSDGYTGYSSQAKYPAICNGMLSITADKIIFHNACVWTADFDGTLILDGEYKLDVIGDSLVFHKDYNGIIFTRDIYKLKKQ